MFQDLSVRKPALEEMDRPDIDPRALEGALRSLVRINAIGNGAGIFWPSMRALLEAGSGPIRVLDVGCGAGDMSRRLEGRARRAGFSLQVDGCDRNPVAVAMARRENAAAGCTGEFFVCDAVTDDFPRDYDVVISSLFLHHLGREESIRALARMADCSQQMLLVSDLLRSRFGLLLVHVATRLFSASPVVHRDGVTSLLAAYTLPEIAALLDVAGVRGATVARRWPERFLLEWRRLPALQK